MNSKLDGQLLNFLLCYWQTKGKKTKDNPILNFHPYTVQPVLLTPFLYT